MAAHLVVDPAEMLLCGEHLIRDLQDPLKSKHPEVGGGGGGGITNTRIERTPHRRGSGECPGDPKNGDFKKKQSILFLFFRRAEIRWEPQFLPRAPKREKGLTSIFIVSQTPTSNWWAVQICLVVSIQMIKSREII